MMAPASSVAHNVSPKRHSRIRVFIADETPLGCQLLSTALRPQKGIEVAALAFSARDLLARMCHTSVDLLLISAHLSEGHLSGLKAVKDLHAAYPTIPIVVLCDRPDDDFVVDAFRAGARGLMCRSESIETLRECIRAVWTGDIWANSKQLRVALGALAQVPVASVTNRRGINLLTRREGQVVKLLADGLTSQEVATKLGLTKHTISNYLFHIYNKLGVSNRVELVLYLTKQHEQTRTASSNTTLPGLSS